MKDLKMKIKSLKIYFNYLYLLVLQQTTSRTTTNILHNFATAAAA
jgi:hypothetical protein